jgi:hypothetical protein
MGFKAIYPLVMKDNFASGRMVEPRNAVKKCGLPRAIWPDEAHNIALIYSKVNIVYGCQSAKDLGKIFGLKKHGIIWLSKSDKIEKQFFAAVN